MSHNSFGKNFTVTSFGESHGENIGVIIDGCPSNVFIDREGIQFELNRRKPGQSKITTSRKETDEFQITSGIFNGKTTGAPICIVIPNQNANSKDYDHLSEVYRPSHADFTYEKKYGNRDFKGGGRSSARVTAGWVAAGAIAKQLLKSLCEIEIVGYVSQIYTVECNKSPDYSIDNIESSMVRCPAPKESQLMIEAIIKAKKEGDSLGGIVSTIIRNCPVGVGDPVFHKLNAQLAHAMFSINAVKGFQIGSGFDSIIKKGSELNDEWVSTANGPQTKTNNSGGIQGGISNGMPILFDVAFKPTATISKKQHTIDKSNNAIELEAYGRHDPCVVPRAVPIVEAMTALVLVDNLLP